MLLEEQFPTGAVFLALLLASRQPDTRVLEEVEELGSHAGGQGPQQVAD